MECNHRYIISGIIAGANGISSRYSFVCTKCDTVFTDTFLEIPKQPYYTIEELKSFKKIDSPSYFKNFICW